MRAADLAMYRAKSKGRARYELFEGPVDPRALDRQDPAITLAGRGPAPGRTPVAGPRFAHRE